MREILFCYALLLNNDLMSLEAYNKYLDSIFAENSTDNLLIDLEFISSNKKETVKMILEEWKFAILDNDIFSKTAISQLKNTYYNKVYSLEDFAKHAYLFWKSIPTSISCEEPLHILSYADDPLSCGDKKQTSELYEKFFEYYNF